MRVSYETLVYEATNTPHKFLNFRVKKLLEKGWKIWSVNSKGGVTVVCVTGTVNGKSRISVIYPNGLMRSESGRISWNWKEATNYAEATIPTPGLDYSE